MRFPRKSGQLPLASGVVFALLLTGLIAPSKAAASCGDYVQRGAKSGGQAANMAHGEHPTMPGEYKFPGESKFPCSGPNCSQGSHAPVVPVPTIPPNSNQWALGLPTFSLANRESVSTWLLS